MKPCKVVLGAIVLLSFMMPACTNDNQQTKVETSIPSTKIRNEVDSITDRGVYYWKTSFKVSDTEKQFLKDQKINKIYLRLFDVDYSEDYDGIKKAVPIATTRFYSEIPADVEIVPVVYITQLAIKRDCTFAKELYTRIMAMGKRNGFSDKIREIQLDCDWTATSEKKFFQLCKELSACAKTANIQVSATIRLHQLNKKNPPVDKGVLMLYNTGSLYQSQVKNSILSYQDVIPYLRNTVSYKLPLSLAFPIYGWAILFRNNKFAAILHHTDFSNAHLYLQRKDHRYLVKKTHYLDDIELQEGDELRLERPSYDEIIKVKDKVKSCLESSICGNIVYHLDSLELSKFNQLELTNILK